MCFRRSMHTRLFSRSPSPTDAGILFEPGELPASVVVGNADPDVNPESAPFFMSGPPLFAPPVQSAPIASGQSSPPQKTSVVGTSISVPPTSDTASILPTNSVSSALSTPTSVPTSSPAPSSLSSTPTSLSSMPTLSSTIASSLSTSTSSQNILSFTTTSQLMSSGSAVTSSLPTANPTVTSTIVTSSLPLSTPFSSTSTPTPTAVHSPSFPFRHSAALPIAIVFSIVIGIGLLVALLTCSYRVRNSKVSQKSDIEDQDLGFGLGRYNGLCRRATGETRDEKTLNEKEGQWRTLSLHHDATEPQFADPFGDGAPNTGFGPYPTPRALPPHLRSTDTLHPQGTPYPASDLGQLQVANLVYGDMSGDEASRPGTRLDHTGEHGTPREILPGPRFLNVAGHALTVPWATQEPTYPQMYPREDPYYAAYGPTGGANARADTNWENLPPLPLPGGTRRDSYRRTPYPDQGSSGSVEVDGWAATLRSSLATAFNTVAGGVSRESTRRRAQSEDVRDHYPTGPQRSSTSELRRSVPASLPQLSRPRPSDLTYETTAPLFIPPAKTTQSAYLQPTDNRSQSRRTAEFNIEAYYAAPTRASSVYSMASYVSRGAAPPRLPSIAPLSRTSTMHGSKAISRGSTRPTMMARMDSSMSDMTTTTLEGCSDEHEHDSAIALAKRSLRERRKKTMGVHADRGMVHGRSHSARKKRFTLRKSNV